MCSISASGISQITSNHYLGNREAVSINPPHVPFPVTVTEGKFSGAVLANNSPPSLPDLQRPSYTSGLQAVLQQQQQL